MQVFYYTIPLICPCCIYPKNDTEQLKSSYHVTYHVAPKSFEKFLLAYPNKVSKSNPFSKLRHGLTCNEREIQVYWSICAGIFWSSNSEFDHTFGISYFNDFDMDMSSKRRHTNLCMNSMQKNETLKIILTGSLLHEEDDLSLHSL